MEMIDEVERLKAKLKEAEKLCNVYRYKASVMERAAILAYEKRCAWPRTWATQPSFQHFFDAACEDIAKIDEENINVR